MLRRLRSTALLLAVLLLVEEARGYSTGAPASACNSMVPSHGGQAPQSTQSPFQITPGGASTNGSPVSVTLAGVSPTANFKGFFLQARDANTSVVIGRFTTTSHKLVNCDSSIENAVTHLDKTPKQSVVVQWTPPSGYAGDVTFRATVVQDYSTFWTGVTSEKVTVKRSVAEVPPSTSKAPATTTQTTAPTTTSAVSGGVVLLPGASNPGDAAIRVVDAPRRDGVPANSDVVSASTLTVSVAAVEDSESTSPVAIRVVDAPLSAQSGPSAAETDSELTAPILPESLGAANDFEESPAAAPTPSTGGATTRARGLLRDFRGRVTTAAPARSVTTTSSPKRVRIAGSSAAPMYVGCNSNKGCFGVPLNCVASSNCKVLFTYTKSDGGYHFEIMGDFTGNQGNVYAAGGLSFDEFMGDDSVVACVLNNGVVDAVMTYNQGKDNVFLKEPHYGLTDITTSFLDGVLLCRYTRAARLVVGSNTYDLDNGTFHLQVAHGPLDQDGTLDYHAARLASAQATSLGQFEALSGVDNQIFLVLHACFMVAAWVGAASTGIFIARYFKQTWKSYKTCGIDQWFHCHRFFMILTWVLTMSSLGLILWYKQGWTDTPADVNPHAYIGIVSIALCFIQPFMAALRCSPKDSRRPIFNWLHWGVGNAAQILGITAIFYGLDLYGLPRWTWWLMIAFVGVHCLLHILMSIGECVSDSKAKKQVSGGLQMTELHSSRDMLQPPLNYDAPGGTFRKALLALYLVSVWLVVAALIAVIVMDEEQLEKLGIDHN
ncbi:putative ferric-chelate reductase 1 homolog isoform X1 [Hyalella azteca]|uniref:Ferric-chelate reductase 1 homolog isoform X1 n=1 Tax=Hyalella azteca TaxID=294128 RepID=A0A8B7PFZ1_HYAAZ|nr:putative ferric-chelate reductase 1 homolog isoform X1 [Hyalella azteca]